MAANIWRPAGIDNLWGNFHNWSLLAVPTAGDGNIATFDANVLSGPCTVNVSAVCNNIDLSAYNNTITMSNGIAVSGNITLGTGFTVSGSGNLTVKATSTINFGGASWPNTFIFGATATYTLSADLTTVNLSTTTGSATINGTFNLKVSGNLSLGTNLIIGTGAPVVVMNGIGNYVTTGGVLQISLTINTAGTITLSNNISVSVPAGLTIRFTYTTGTLTQNGKALDLSAGNYTGTFELDCAGITWATVQCSNNANISLVNNFNLTNWSNSGQITVNGNSAGKLINCAGNWTMSANNVLNGTNAPKVVFNGTGTWGNTSGTGNLRLDVDINTAGTITGAANIYWNTGTLHYIAGTVDFSSSTFNIGISCILNTTGMNFGAININGNSTTTLSSALVSTGSFSVAAAVSATMNGSTYACGGASFTISSGSLSGTTSITLNRSGDVTWSSAASSALSTNFVANNLTINITGVITFNAATYRTGTLTFQSGTFSTGSGLGLVLQGACTFDSGNFPIEGNSPLYFAYNIITLLNNVFLKGNVTLILCVGGSGITTTINGFNIYFDNGIRNQGNTSCGGTTNFVFTGNTATWDSGAATNNTINNNLSFNGSVMFVSGTVLYGTGTLQLITGKIVPLIGSVLNLVSSCTLIKMNTVKWTTVTITAGTTITMDRFFQGTPLNPVRVQSTSSSNYTITFSQGGEQYTQYSKISNCTLSQTLRMQAIYAGANKGGNIGVRFGDSDINGFPNNALQYEQCMQGINGLSLVSIPNKN